MLAGLPRSSVADAVRAKRQNHQQREANPRPRPERRGTAFLSRFSSNVLLKDEHGYRTSVTSPETVVEKPAAASNIGTSVSTTYDHCGYDPFEPPPIFNNLPITPLATGAPVESVRARFHGSSRAGRIDDFQVSDNATSQELTDQCYSRQHAC
jgi:hypothetical protein